MNPVYFDHMSSSHGSLVFLPGLSMDMQPLRSEPRSFPVLQFVYSGFSKPVSHIALTNLPTAPVHFAAFSYISTIKLLSRRVP